jgi:hypothetical protein
MFGVPGPVDLHCWVFQCEPAPPAVRCLTFFICPLLAPVVCQSEAVKKIRTASRQRAENLMRLSQNSCRDSSGSAAFPLAAKLCFAVQSMFLGLRACASPAREAQPHAKKQSGRHLLRRSRASPSEGKRQSRCRFYASAIRRSLLSRRHFTAL